MAAEAAYAGVDLNGIWEFEDLGGIANATLALRQEGARITGAVYYETGSALLEGEAGPADACIYITYDAAKVLAKWVPTKYTSELKGLRSRMNHFLSRCSYG